MSKRSQQKKAREKRRRQQQKREKQILTNADLKQVVVWKDRIEANIQDAIDCYKRMHDNGLLEDKDLMTALSKYVENTAEAVTQLDGLTHGQLFASLIEIPSESDEGDALTWKNLKGIRIPVAHKFWETNHSIVLTTVREDFPLLRDMFARLYIAPTILEKGADVRLSVADLTPPVVGPDIDEFLFPGGSCIWAIYTRPGAWIPMRLLKNLEDEDWKIVSTEFRRSGQESG